MDKIEFSGDVLGQANYLCFLAKSLVLDEYQKGPFYLTPKLVAGDERTIFFPDFSYPSWFWREIKKKASSNYGEPMPKKAVEFAKEKLNEQTADSGQQIVKEWRAVEKDYFISLRKFLRLGPVLDKTKIEVLLTPFGTPGSFYSSKTTSRLDLGIKNIGRTVFLALYHVREGGNYMVGETRWYVRQGIMNFIMNQTALSSIFMDEPEKIKPQEFELAQTSRDYFQKLGFPQTSCVVLSDGNILVNGENAGHLFAPQERALLDFLATRRNQIVSFDEAGEAVWGNESYERFSLEVLAKVVEGIRKKLVLAGVNKELVFTKRKQGYVLID